MRLHHCLSLPLAMLALACSPNASDKTAKSDETAATPSDKKSTDTAKSDGPAAKTADGDKEPASDAEKAAAEKEKLAKIQKRLEGLKTASAAEAERWTDELKAEAKALVNSEVTSTEAMLEKILAGSHRRPGNSDRDGARHPKETLSFFGIEPSMSVIEVGPGAGWYTEILAPLLAKNGKLVVNSGDPNGPETESSIYYARRTRDFLGTNTDLYGKVGVVIPPEPGAFHLGEPNSADAVLIIRGLHGAARRGELETTLKEVSRVLKPGGTFGIIQHRGTKGADPVKSAENGYVPEAWLTEQVKAAGFSLSGSSEINGNAKDMHDHPEGVWSLPPSLSGDDGAKAKYEAIGESDRMTLKFQKPA